MISRSEAKELIATNLNDINAKDIVDRQESDELESHLNKKQVTAISGVRRSGKTYLMFQLIKKLSNAAYVNFENPRFDDSLKQLDTIYEAMLEYYKEGGRMHLFLDEIQNIRGWERWVATMYEKNIKFFVSGSNASLLASEFSKSLSGRHKLVRIYPLSFSQFLNHRNPGIASKKQQLVTENKAWIMGLLEEYLHYGGFPEVVFEGRDDMLKDYFEDILTKDIIARHNLKFKQSLKELAHNLITNISSPHSLYSLNKLIQARSINTIKNYLLYLEDAYLIIRIPYFSYSIRKQRVNPFKIYCIDTGMRNAVSFRFSSDMGKLYENTVALELVRRNTRDNIFYWKTSKHEEVDFLVKEGNSIKQAIQVCYDLEDPKTRERETKSLVRACEHFKLEEGTIITNDTSSEENINSIRIRFRPLWEWLLNSQ